MIQKMNELRTVKAYFFFFFNKLINIIIITRTKLILNVEQTRARMLSLCELNNY